MATGTTRGPAIVIEPAGTSGGNKRGTGNAGSGSGPTIVDPVDVGGTATGGPDSDTGTGNRSRGRPRGTASSGASQKEKPNAFRLAGMESTLLSIHTMLAAMTQVPEMMIDPAEAKSLVTCAENVARHYAVGGMTEKTVDWLNLFMALGAVYGTRIVAVNARSKSNKAKDVTPKARPPQQAQPGSPMGEAEAWALVNAGAFNG